jgi:sporulation protein YlmC with PRC-barrel domain
MNKLKRSRPRKARSIYRFDRKELVNMRRVSYLLGTLLIVSMLLAACGGEETSTTVPSTNVPPITAESTSTEDTSALTGTPEGTAGAGTTTPGVPVTGEDSTSRVSNLLDYDVWNQDGEQIGEVEDMVLDMDNSTVSYVVIETGGFLDLGDKTLLVPWNSLELQTPVSGGNENGFVLTADPEMLNNAPDIDLTSVLPIRGEPANDWDVDIRNFWEGGVVPSATQATGDATATTTTGEATATPEMTATTASGTGSGTGTGPSTGQDKLQGVMLASEVIGSTIVIGQGEAQGQVQETATVEAPAVATSTVDAAASPAASPEATTSSGTGVTNDNQGPTEATIEDIIIDPDTGDILFLVLSSLFDGEDRWIPVPLSTLRWDMTNESFLFVADANALQNAPFFLSDEFPDTSTEGWDLEFDDFWQNNGTGTGIIPTATP